MCLEHDRPGRKRACSNNVLMIFLKTLLVIGRSVMPLHLLHSPKSPFLSNLTMSPVFHASGICSLSHLFKSVCQKAWCFRIFRLAHFCCHPICSTCLSTIHCIDGCSYFFQGRWICADYQIPCCRWGFCHLCRSCPI